MRGEGSLRFMRMVLLGADSEGGDCGSEADKRLGSVR